MSKKSGHRSSDSRSIGVGSKYTPVHCILLDTEYNLRRVTVPGVLWVHLSSGPIRAAMLNALRQVVLMEHDPMNTTQQEETVRLYA
jgi:hypothetical protein